MSKIAVIVDAEGQDSFTFDWEGDVQAMQGIVDATRGLAQRSGRNPGQFVREWVTQFPSTGPLPGGDGETQRMVMLCVVVLYLVNEYNNGLPGPMPDRLARYDIIATVTVRGEDFSVEIEGLPRTLH
jgi:hypothetical protein